ncbi:hypothetical protein I541_5615 [Mycobacteroides abscessus]|nr:hypothetical protein I541_5615 [Mycobacteroides abscessus]
MLHVEHNSDLTHFPQLTGPLQHGVIVVYGQTCARPRWLSGR